MDLKVINFERINKNGISTLKGKFMVEIMPGMAISDFTYHERSNGERWCSLPAGQYLKDGGCKRGYEDIIRFNDPERKVKFKDWLLSEVDRMRS